MEVDTPEPTMSADWGTTRFRRIMYLASRISCMISLSKFTSSACVFGSFTISVARSPCFACFTPCIHAWCHSASYATM